MDKSIPKSTHTMTYQLKITQEITNLEKQFRLLQQNSTTNGWSNEHFREYTRIRQEIRERCKENYYRNWELKVNKLIKNSKNIEVSGVNLKQ